MNKSKNVINVTQSRDYLSLCDFWVVAGVIPNKSFDHDLCALSSLGYEV